MAKRVVVVGAGLSGLVSARTLLRKGVDTVVYEASDGPGGRIRTDLFEGFRIDRGFQVFFEAYLHARIEFDLRALAMKPYRRGALIQTELGFKKLDAQNPLMTVLNPAFGLSDTARLGLLAANTLAGRVRNSEQSTEQLLQRAGFSDTVLQRFFRPFLGGIFLDPTLNTSSAQFSFIFQMLILGKVSTPALGMGMLTQQVADSLPRDSVFYNSPVKSVSSEGITLSNGETVECDEVILACDPPTTASLLGESYDDGSLSSSTIYFESTYSPVDEPFIVLNGTGQGMVNLVSPLSVVSPQLAPPGKHLIAVTTFSQVSNEAVVEDIKAECDQWFPSRQVSDWRHLKTVHVPFAQYRQTRGFQQNRPKIETRIPNVYRGGEILTNSSIDGACQAGQWVARRILEH
jgi:phytoene dehydrogenase-like protein